MRNYLTIEQCQANLDRQRMLKHYKITSSEPITEAQARDYQVADGYHWKGYGFYGFKCKQEDNNYVASWSRGSHCE